ncbi:acyltransferase family protein [Citrobacter koseri]|uniref:acyltransferase family protein n=1 Tax=Citrobacter koseri TaxID=545 RepID=UPI00190898B2|nr:acyltransferase [Citrobacter koseri]MBJ8809825.1 acyltransferase [Citrobacter koseri]
MNKNKITHLEGLRGLCCFIVVLDHCVNAFFPELRFTGVSNLQDIIAWSPLNLIYSGIPSVYIFFILSGFVLSHKYNQKKDNNILVSAAIKRYPRLIIPVFFSMIIMFIFTWASNELFMTKHILSIEDVFIQSFIYAPFGGGKLSNGVLWTIVFEIYGSFLVFSALAIFGCYRYKYFIYAILFFLTFNSNYCLFIFGMALNSMYNEGISFKLNNKLASYVVLVVSITLMAFPFTRQGVEIGGIYKNLMFLDSPYENRIILSKIGAMMLFWSMFNLKVLVRFFDTSILQTMGMLSFSVYILHMPTLQFIRNLNINTSSNIEKLYIMSFLVLSITIVLSFLFEKFVDRASVKYTNAFARKVL